MEIKELLNLLKLQKNNLSLFLSSAQQKQRALISFNYEDLQQAIEGEEKMLSAIQETEKKRLAFLSAFYKEQSLSNNTFKIAELVGHLGENVDRKIILGLEILEKEIKKLVSAIMTINQQNQYLIENSRAFIRETINSIMNAKKTLLDKKV